MSFSGIKCTFLGKSHVLSSGLAKVRWTGCSFFSTESFLYVPNWTANICNFVLDNLLVYKYLYFCTSQPVFSDTESLCVGDTHSLGLLVDKDDLINYQLLII
jgi:hypothetical protein